MFININFTGLSERVIHFLFFEMKFIKRNNSSFDTNKGSIHAQQEAAKSGNLS